MNSLLKYIVCAALLCATTISAKAEVNQDKEFLTTVKTQNGVMDLIRQAVGNDGIFDPQLTEVSFQHVGKYTRYVKLILKPALRGETKSGATKRLEAEGYQLENTAELASFLAQYPNEVAKSDIVIAAGSASLQRNESGRILAPFAFILNGQRGLFLGFVDYMFYKPMFFLVSRK